MATPRQFVLQRKLEKESLSQRDYGSIQFLPSPRFVTPTGARRTYQSASYEGQASRSSLAPGSSESGLEEARHSPYSRRPKHQWPTLPKDGRPENTTGCSDTRITDEPPLTHTRESGVVSVETRRSSKDTRDLSAVEGKGGGDLAIDDNETQGGTTEQTPNVERKDANEAVRLCKVDQQRARGSTQSSSFESRGMASRPTTAVLDDRARKRRRISISSAPSPLPSPVRQADQIAMAMTVHHSDDSGHISYHGADQRPQRALIDDDDDDDDDIRPRVHGYDGDGTGSNDGEETLVERQKMASGHSRMFTGPFMRRRGVDKSSATSLPSFKPDLVQYQASRLSEPGPSNARSRTRARYIDGGLACSLQTWLGEAHAEGMRYDAGACDARRPEVSLALAKNSRMFSVACGRGTSGITSRRPVKVVLAMRNERGWAEGFAGNVGANRVFVGALSIIALQHPVWQVEISGDKWMVGSHWKAGTRAHTYTADDDLGRQGTRTRL
jgi:hypothetical protein